MVIKKYKDGKFLDKDGYVLVPMPKDEEELYKPLYNFKGMGYEHRIVAAKELKRLLHANERPHHKDKNRTNNSPENLIVKDVIEHLLEHKAQGDLKLFSKDYQPRWKNSVVRESLKIPKKENKQFNMGMKTELEHKDITKGDPVLTGKIVKAHLKEMPDYYTKLKKMEKGAAEINKTTAIVLGSTFGSIPGLIDFWKSRHYQGRTRQELQAKGAKKIIIGGGLGAVAGNIGQIALGGQDRLWSNVKGMNPKFTKNIALGSTIGALPGAIDFAIARTPEKRKQALKRSGWGASIGGGVGGFNSVLNKL